MGRQGRLPLDSPLRSRGVRSDRNIADYPFFDLSRSGNRKRPLHYNDGVTYITVHPGPSGMATMYDKDLILYVASLMIERLRNGETPSQYFRFTAHDFMRVANRDTSLRSYENLRKALSRLQGTQIDTNIEVGGEGEDGMFSWFPEAHARYRRDSDGTKRLKHVDVTICNWLYRAILEERFLSYDPRYFELRPLERRLYDLARSYCDGDAWWAVRLEELRQKAGYEGHLRKFKAQLLEIMEGTDIPEYGIRFYQPGDPLTRDLRDAGWDLRAKVRTKNADMIVLFTPKRRQAAARETRDGADGPPATSAAEAPIGASAT